MGFLQELIVMVLVVIQVNIPSYFGFTFLHTFSFVFQIIYQDFKVIELWITAQLVDQAIKQKLKINLAKLMSLKLKVMVILKE